VRLEPEQWKLETFDQPAASILNRVVGQAHATKWKTRSLFVPGEISAYEGKESIGSACTAVRKPRHRLRDAPGAPNRPDGHRKALSALPCSRQQRHLLW
jgi:hypothetical protein